MDITSQRQTDPPRAHLYPHLISETDNRQPTELWIFMKRSSSISSPMTREMPCPMNPLFIENVKHETDGEIRRKTLNFEVRNVS